MVVTAKLRVAAIHRRWADEGRHGGVVSGVHFRRRGVDYIAHDLTVGDVDALRGHPEVELAVQGQAEAVVAEESPGDAPATDAVADDADDADEAPESVDADVDTGPGRRRRKRVAASQ